MADTDFIISYSDKMACNKWVNKETCHDSMSFRNEHTMLVMEFHHPKILVSYEYPHKVP